MRADAFEYLLGDVGMLGEDAGWADARARAEPRGAKPWELARLHERKTLVVGLEQLAPFVQTLAPGGVVGGDARVEHQVVVAAGHGEWVELDPAEPPEDLKHAVTSTVERTRGREHVPGDEETPCSVSVDVHTVTLPACDQRPISSVNAGSSRSGSKSESRFAISRQPSHMSIAWRRCSIASAFSPTRLSQHAVLK